jgi:uncharacterized protein (TIGR03437 family)
MALLCAACPAQTAGAYTITTVAGNATNGYAGDGSAATSAELGGPAGLAVDSSHRIYVSDQYNHRVRQFTVGGNISTVAGNGTAGETGDGSAATSAELNNPTGVAVDSSGNYYIADTTNCLIRKVTSSGTISTVAGNTNATCGFLGDGGTATLGQLQTPTAVAVDSAGNLYIADTGNFRIRKVANGNISTVAGNGFQGTSGDGGAATAARLNSPRGVAVDSSNNIYISDSGNHRIRKVSNGTITTIAGTGTAGFSGDGGPATSAQLNSPRAIALDAAGNLYIADYTNSRIRKVSVNGIITTLAGTGRFGYTGDGGPALSAQLNFPSGVTVDTDGSIYIGDTGNNVVRVLSPSLANGAPPSINQSGVLSAQAFGGFTSAAPGSWIEIYGANLASDARPWNTNDFRGVNAPNSLDGTFVTIGGQQAFIDYISSGQVNAQIPSTVAPGTQQITITNAAGTSDPYPITVNPTQPGLLAPASFNIGGKQYVVALFSDLTTYVAPPGAIPGVTSRQARAGDIIILFGVGFGAVTPSIPAGQIALQSNSLTAPFQVFFGQLPAASVPFDGLAPNYVGLYQFNVTVPNVAASDTVPLTFTLNGVSGTQTLYTAVQN